MNEDVLQKELTHQLKHLKPEQQLEVLLFARSLGRIEKKKVAGKSLLAFIGAIDKEDLEIMKQTIEEGCEKVNPDEW